MTHGSSIAGREAAQGGEVDEDRLVAGLLAGDAASFDRLVAVYQARVARLAHRLLAWPTDVDDVVQEVFLAVWRHRERFRGQSRLSTWLTAITVNKCRSHERKRLLRLRLAREPSATESRRPTTRPSPLDDESFETVRQGIQSLPRRCREVVVLRYLEEMAINEISDALGITDGAVHVRLNRARARLAKSVGHLGNR